MKSSLIRFSVFTSIFLLCLVFSCEQQAEEMKVEEKAEADLELNEIPKVVMDALKARFPDAEIHEWTKEKEGDIVVYDIEFKQQDRKFEADIKEDGAIHNWEKEIPAEDLPEAAMKAVETKYPKATIQEIMEITAVNDGKEALEGYEVVLETADQKEVEVTVAPDGGILEDSGEEE
ncbi:MAG: PepSY-like domain-containing protein [Candidatus Zixiibacteriota bacterium]